MIGDDIGEYALQGYKDGGCNPGEELDGVSATVTRHETTLGEALKAIYENDKRIFYNMYEADEPRLAVDVPDEMFLGALFELILDHGPLADTIAQRYDFGRLDDLFSETRTMKRVMYLSYELVIPAGESVQISAAMVKDASMDFIGKYKKRNGYEMVTRLGSDIAFTLQTASILNTDNIEIVNQNFGFDIKNSVTEVTLDMEIPHYWLEVQKLQ